MNSEQNFSKRKATQRQNQGQISAATFSIPMPNSPFGKLMKMGTTKTLRPMCLYVLPLNEQELQFRKTSKSAHCTRVCTQTIKMKTNLFQVGSCSRIFGTLRLLFFLSFLAIFSVSLCFLHSIAIRTRAVVFYFLHCIWCERVFSLACIHCSCSQDKTICIRDDARFSLSLVRWMPIENDWF